MTPNSQSIFFARFYMYVQNPYQTTPEIMSRKAKIRTKEGYSQSHYFPVHSLGTAPFLVCMHHLPRISLIHPLTASSVTHSSSAAPR